jgi:hypothetical protein
MENNLLSILTFAHKCVVNDESIIASWAADSPNTNSSMPMKGPPVEHSPMRAIATA